MESADGVMLYVGAGTDIRRALKLATANQTIILMDSQPYSEYGKLQCGELRADGTDGYSRPGFVADVAKQFRKHRLVVDPRQSTNTTWVGVRGERVVLTYFMNTSLPEDLRDVSRQLAGVGTLLVRGYHPPVALLNALPTRNLLFVGGYGTSYSRDEDEKDTLVYWLHSDSKTRLVFITFEYHRGDGKSVRFSRWDAFCQYAATQNARGCTNASCITDATTPYEL